MKFEHGNMLFDSSSVEDALDAVKHFGYLPVQFMSEVESGQGSPALIRVYEYATAIRPKRVFLNLTQSKSTYEQLMYDIVDLPDETHQKVQKLLTFNGVAPQRNAMAARAADIAQIAVENGATHALIGGAPFFMSHLERALKAEGIWPLYSFGRGIVEEETQEDGSVKKVTVFKHEGFVHV